MFYLNSIDMWLRKKLEPKTGCLPLQTISSFKRVSELTMQHADKLAFIKSALAGSKLVEGEFQVFVRFFSKILQK